MKDNQREILTKAIKDFGARAQIGMLYEECGELISALNKFDRGRIPITDVITEIADVTIMVWQIAIIFGENQVSEEIERKMERLQHRIEKYEEIIKENKKR